ncbi:MAG TPA: LytTR family DNA-binding domain-containing protein, partial [Thermoanaerobaculia bacterium]
FAPSRLHRLADRLRRRLAAPPADDLAARLERLLATAQPAPPPTRQLLVEREPGRQHLLALDDVHLLRADGNYVTLHTTQATYRRRGTLQDLEARLDANRFLRLNRGEIVRTDAIREIQPWFHGDARVVLKDGSVLTWSRRYRAKTEGVL